MPVKMDQRKLCNGQLFDQAGRLADQQARSCRLSSVAKGPWPLWFAGVCHLHLQGPVPPRGSGYQWNNGSGGKKRVNALMTGFFFA
jgi:hypothetical protein